MRGVATDGVNQGRQMDSALVPHREVRGTKTPQLHQGWGGIVSEGDTVHSIRLGDSGGR